MCSSNAGRCPADRPTSDVPERVAVEEEEELVRSVAAAILLSTTKGARTARPAADDASATCTCVRACVRRRPADRRRYSSHCPAAVEREGRGNE